MAILGLFDIGKTALLTNRRALDTIAHNVANSATPGYTRQDVILENIPTGNITTTGTTGRGVRIAEIKRMYDSFLTLQLRTEKSNLSYWDAYEKGIIKIENVFNEASDTGIGFAITDFFNAWQEVAQNPEGYAQRTLLIKKAEYLSSRISGAYNTLDDERTEIFKSSQSLVDEVNSIAAKIADLNDKIAATPGALDLKDQRDLLIEDLNEIIKVSTFEDNAGRYSVLVGGIPLVDGGKTYSMSVTTDTANTMHFYVNLESEVKEVTDYITGGQLKANLDLRDTKILDYINKLNAFAIDLSFTVNYYHRQGYGLDSSTGNDFFQQLYSITDPTAGGTISAIDFTDLSKVNFSKMYRIDYNTTGGPDYQQEGTSGIYWRVQESTDGTTWTAISPLSVTLSYDTSTIPDYRTLEFQGVKIRIEGNQGDLINTGTEQFGVSFNPTAAKYMAAAINDPQKVAAASGDEITIDGSNNKIRFSENGGSTYVTATIPQGTYTRAQLAAALQQALENADTGTTYNYTVSYNAITKKYQITNNGATPNPNPIILDWTHTSTTAEGIFGFSSNYTINPTGSATSDFAVYPVLPGDNSNAKLIANLGSQTILSGTTSIDFYRTMVSDVGVEAASSKTNLKFQNTLVEELERRRQETSGVSLDEEAANLIKYQKSFEAAAKLISVADELLTALINMTGR